jgi:hypothetical protein
MMRAGAELIEGADIIAAVPLHRRRFLSVTCKFTWQWAALSGNIRELPGTGEKRRRIKGLARNGQIGERSRPQRRATSLGMAAADRRNEKPGNPASETVRCKPQSGFARLVATSSKAFQHKVYGRSVAAARRAEV